MFFGSGYFIVVCVLVLVVWISEELEMLNYEDNIVFDFILEDIVF